VDDLVVVEAVSTETEAELICSILRGEGIQSFQRQTSLSAGMTDGLPVGGPREVVVRAEDADEARNVLALQRRRPV
jgi:Putative prokaryotic signal transducing protein